MTPSKIRARQGQRLLQVGVASLEGFAIEYLPIPRLGLSVHTLSVVEGLVLAVLGLLWNRLDLNAAGARAAFWLFLDSAFATLVPYGLAALWGAGGSTITLVAARGSAVEELTIKVVLYSAAPAAIFSLFLNLWGTTPHAGFLKGWRALAVCSPTPCPDGLMSRHRKIDVGRKSRSLSPELPHGQTRMTVFPACRDPNTLRRSPSPR